MNIPDQLRWVARRIAAHDNTLLFICHELADLNGVPQDDAVNDLPAVRFLKDLGMPLDGGGFSSWTHNEGDYPMPNPTPVDKRQEIRATWCEFAADLAEEWRIL